MSDFWNTPAFTVLKNVLDIISVAYLFYFLYTLFRDTNSISIIKGFLFILAIYLIATLIGLDTLAWVLQYIFSSFVVIAVVLFQPEIRRLFSRIGRSGLSAIREKISRESVQEISRACFMMAEDKTGALIIIARNTGLHDLHETATDIDAGIKAELLLSIFFKNNILHDGAVLIENERITAAHVIIPSLIIGNLSKSRIKRPLGTRHRAGIAITTETDALSIIVSEETGKVSLAHDGKLEYDLTPDKLIKRMEDALGHK